MALEEDVPSALKVVDVWGQRTLTQIAGKLEPAILEQWK